MREIQIQIHYDLECLAKEISRSKLSKMIPFHVNRVIIAVEPVLKSQEDKKLLKTIGRRMSKYVGYWNKTNIDYYIHY
jgi:hypothetical protein